VDFLCDIIGDGPLFGRLSERVAQGQLEGRVRLEGGREASEVLARFASCDIFALPCVIAGDGDRDGMPVALAEAMAMEVPVIATDILGISEMLRPGTGFLVPPADPVAMADAIEALHQAGTEGRREMGERARAVIARDFSLREGVRELLRRFAQAGAEANHTANGHRVYGEARV